MSPHGKPDWGHLPSTTIFGLDDMGEAVVRLDSPVLWDRRGEVILLDDFEDGLGKCIPNIPATDGAVYRYTGASAHGTICLRVRTGTDPVNTATIAWEIPPPVLSCIGLECSFGFSVLTRYIRWDIEHSTGGTIRQARLRYDHVNQIMECLNPAGGYTPCVSGLTTDATDAPAHILKLVINPTFDYYWRVILDNTEYDLSAYPYRVFSPAVGEEVIFRVYVEGRVVNSTKLNGALYLDRVIGTQNEPII